MHYKLNWTEIFSLSSRSKSRAALFVCFLVYCQNVPLCYGGLSSSLSDDDLYQLINLATTGQKFNGRPDIYYAEPDSDPHSQGSSQSPSQKFVPFSNGSPGLVNTQYNIPLSSPFRQYEPQPLQYQQLHPVRNVDLGLRQHPLHLQKHLIQLQQQQYGPSQNHPSRNRYVDGKKRSSAIEIVSSLELPSEHTQYLEDPLGGLVKIVPQPEEHQRHQQHQLPNLSQPSQSVLTASIAGPGPSGNYLPVGNSIAEGAGVLPPPQLQLIPQNHNRNHLIQTHQPQVLPFPIFKNIQTRGPIYQFALPPNAVLPSPGVAPTPALGPTYLPLNVTPGKEPSRGAPVHLVPSSLSNPTQSQLSQVQAPNPTSPSTSAPVQQPQTHHHPQLHQFHQESHRAEHQQAVQKQLLAKSTPSALAKHEPTPTPNSNESNSPVSIQRPQLYAQHPQFVHQPQPIQFGRQVIQSQGPQLPLPPQVIPQIQQQPTLFAYRIQSPENNRIPLYHPLIAKYPIQPSNQNVHPQQHLIHQQHPQQQVQFNFIPFGQQSTQHPLPIPSADSNPSSSVESTMRHLPSPDNDEKERITEVMQVDDVEEEEDIRNESYGNRISMSSASEDPLTASEETLIDQVTQDHQQQHPEMEIREHSSSSLTSPGAPITKSVMTTRVMTRYKKPYLMNKSRSVMRATLDSNNNMMKVMEESS